MVSRRKPFDRFINFRIKSEVAQFNVTHDVNDLSDIALEDDDEGFLQPVFINTAKKAHSILSLRKQVLKALGVKQDNVLNFIKNIQKIDPHSEWPVFARDKPLIKAPETVLDMPDIDATFSTNSYYQVVDWNVKGQIATIFQGEVHIWQSGNGGANHTESNQTIGNCVKWNSLGDRLVVSRTQSSISIIDATSLKFLATYSCNCLDSTVTAIEWYSNVIITGWSNGVIKVFFEDGKQQFYVKLDGEVIQLKLSCERSYLMARTAAGVVSVMVTENKDYYQVNPKNIFIKTASWHPWKEPLLVVATIKNQIYLVNVNLKKTIAAAEVKPYFRHEVTYILDFLTFNPLTAELVISFYHENPFAGSANGVNILSVFKNPKTIVDEVQYHIGRVPYACWNSTGTKLATVGIDENLVIWNFFGSEKGSDGHRKKTQKRKSESKLLDLWSGIR